MVGDDDGGRCAACVGCIARGKIAFVISGTTGFGGTRSDDDSNRRAAVDREKQMDLFYSARLLRPLKFGQIIGPVTARDKEVPMRRGYALILLVSVIGTWTSSAFGQYPYPYPPPYGPMPGQYMPPQPYGPMPPPGYYPQPMPQQQPPRVFVYGPLTATPPDPTAPLPGPGVPQQAPAKNAPPKATKTNDQKANIAQAQLTLPPAGANDTGPVSRSQLAQEACGATCFDDICAPTPIYDFIPKDPVLPGHGHFIAEVGAIAMVPIMNPHTAFQAIGALGGTTSTDFPRQADYGPSVQFGYISHTGWGIRADYWYLHGDINETYANNNPAVTFATPAINGLQMSGPSVPLAGGIGVDQYHFSQNLDLQVADLEIVKEQQFLDTSFLFGVGVRYAHFEQIYNATRTNPGGVDAFGDAATFSRADFSSMSRYEGWGPTLSMEVLQPIFKSNFAFYANMRASFMWGMESFQQTDRVQERFTNFLAPTTIIDSAGAAAQLINRQIEVGELEAGLQYGCRIGHRVYLYSRAGVAVQRWFNVGNPTQNNGNVEFIGATLKMGISF
jgi:hypothetical protein